MVPTLISQGADLPLRNVSFSPSKKRAIWLFVQITKLPCPDFGSSENTLDGIRKASMPRIRVITFFMNSRLVSYMDAVEVFLIWVNPDFGRGFLLRFLR